MIQRFVFYLILLATAFGLIACHPSSSSNMDTDVLVIGGGVSGTAAAIQAARTGAEVILVEESPWLGGMLTAAGVSATDGNHRLPSGIWGEFREQLWAHYGGPDSVFTGWVSNTQFEPSVGQVFLARMVDAEPNIQRKHGYRIIEVMKDGNQLTGAVFIDSAGNRLSIQAKICIEATELGDVLEIADVPFWTGQDTKDDPHNVHVQDLTYAAILKDYGKGTAHLLEKPADYDPEEFACFCLELCPDSSGEKLNCETVLNYALLPNDKYMLNWPRRGNDYYVDATKLTWEEQQTAYQKAKNRTLGLVYFIQNEVGYSHLGLADDEYTTADRLPYIPYHREARRVRGMVRMELENLIDPYDTTRQALYPYAIAVGDYPLDHHHDKNPDAAPEEYPPIPSFSIPYYSLIPKEMDGLIVAEKSISVSHIVNGASRLQPCVMLIGQAAGAAAALSVKQQVQARALPIRELQQELLDADCWLMPFLDINPSDWFFESCQKVALSGEMRGHGVSYQWANQTWFYPDSATSETRAEAVLRIWTAIAQPKLLNASNTSNFEDVSDPQLETALAYMESRSWLKHWAEGPRFEPNQPLLRKELAWLIDQVFHPFSQKDLSFPAASVANH